MSTITTINGTDLITDSRAVINTNFSNLNTDKAQVYTSAYASPPGSPAAGDIWMPTDAPYIMRYDGSAWVPWGPAQKLGLPPSAGWTLINDGGL